MNKTEQLLRMLEHPERYTEQQWLDILADEECRELYSLIAKTRGALASQQADERLTDEVIDQQWQRLAVEQPTRAAIVPLWRKVAAAVAVAIVCVSIAIAAVYTGFFRTQPANDQHAEQVTQQHHEQGSPHEVTAMPTDSAGTATEPRLFEEAPLEQILDELAPLYGVEVEYRSDDVRSLRLFYQWEPEYSLDKVVEMLNNFEAFSVRHEGNQLIVEPQEAK